MNRNERDVGRVLDTVGEFEIYGRPLIRSAMFLTECLSNEHTAGDPWKEFMQSPRHEEPAGPVALRIILKQLEELMNTLQRETGASAPYFTSTDTPTE